MSTLEQLSARAQETANRDGEATAVFNLNRSGRALYVIRAADSFPGENRMVAGPFEPAAPAPVAEEAAPAPVAEEAAPAPARKPYARGEIVALYSVDAAAYLRGGSRNYESVQLVEIASVARDGTAINAYRTHVDGPRLAWKLAPRGCRVVRVNDQSAARTVFAARGLDRFESLDALGEALTTAAAPAPVAEEAATAATPATGRPVTFTGEGAAAFAFGELIPAGTPGTIAGEPYRGLLQVRVTAADGRTQIVRVDPAAVEPAAVDPAAVEPAGPSAAEIAWQLARMDDGATESDARAVLIAADESAPMVDRLAAAFAVELRATLSPDQWAAMRARNASPDLPAGCCASHDYCDANEVMAAAWREVTGGPAPYDDGEPSDSDVRTWNQAWAAARVAYLTGPAA